MDAYLELPICFSNTFDKFLNFELSEMLKDLVQLETRILLDDR